MKAVKSTMLGPKRLLGLLAVFAAAPCAVHACSNLLISPGASADGAPMISYAADDSALYGDLALYPAADHPPNATRDTYDWDSGVYLGKIPEVAHTYKVIGNMNEHGLAISETTFGGLASLSSQPGALLSYGGLIWITLQRAKTARAAVQIMGDLVDKYGYYSTGESFSLNDGNEVWYMEMMSKGPGETGAVWVALKVPDGHVTAHANQARIRTWDHESPDAMFAPDVVTFAQRKGLYPPDADPKLFSFSDTYDPVTFEGARFCEARVWSFFGSEQVLGKAFADQYEDYIRGYNLTNRMPVFVKPKTKLSLNATFWHFRNHYEGTALEQRNDVGAGAFRSAYRYSPLTFKSGGAEYVNERAISVQATAWHFTAHVRPQLPPPVRGVLWFGVDDTKHALNVPWYSGTTRVPLSWLGLDCMGRSACRRDHGLPGTITEHSFEAAHWVFNMVSNYAYTRYDQINPVVARKLAETESAWMTEVAGIDKAATELYKSDPAAAAAMVTQFSYDTGARAVKDWLAFWQQLFTTFVDGEETQQDASNAVCACKKNALGYGQHWYDRIANETGDKYKVPSSVAAARDAAPRTLSKTRMLGRSRRAGGTLRS